MLSTSARALKAAIAQEKASLAHFTSTSASMQLSSAQDIDRSLPYKVPKDVASYRPGSSCQMYRYWYCPLVPKYRGPQSRSSGTPNIHMLSL